VQAVSRPCDPPCAPCARVCVERMGCDVLGYLGRTGRIHYGSRAAPPARVPARFSALSGISKGAGSARATRAGRKRDTSSPIHPPPTSPRLPRLPMETPLVAEGFAFLRMWEETRARKRRNYRDRFARRPDLFSPAPVIMPR
jgi:hypothetical protein